MTKVEQLRIRCYNAYAEHKKDIEKCPINHLFSKCDCDACRKAQRSHKAYTQTESPFELAIKAESAEKKRKIALDKSLPLK